MNTYTYVNSPIGRLLLHSDGTALTGLYMDVASRPPRGLGDSVEDASSGPLPDTIRQLDEYFAGVRRAFDLPLRLHGTEFQQRVWNVLMEIPYGVTWSYGELAKRIDQTHGIASGGAGERAQSNFHIGALPSSHRRRRIADGIRRRSGAQAMAIGA